jgi:hypothetical protein
MANRYEYGVFYDAGIDGVTPAQISPPMSNYTAARKWCADERGEYADGKLIVMHRPKTDEGVPAEEWRR